MSFGDADVPAPKCPNCHEQVPAGRFCVLCGARPRADAQWLRRRVFAACPGERVLRPALASSLFPHLPQRSRLPFRIGLVLILIGLVCFATIRITSVVVGIAAFGPPVLFLLYLCCSAVRRDLPLPALPLAALVGVCLGNAWARAADKFAPADYGLAVGPPLSGDLATTVVAAVGGAVLMGAPVVVVRLLPSPAREVLDGFVIGVFGALMFTAAATITRLAVQFQTGVIPHSRPRLNVLVEAGLCGVTIPLSAAATGGVVGLVLWIRPRPDRSGHPRAALWSLFAALLLGYAVIGVVDADDMPQPVMLTAHLGLAILSLMIMRLALQVGLLHETPDPVTLEPLLCEHCEHVVPDGPFCAACGAATRASSKESRRRRRRERPIPLGPAPIVTDVPGQTFPGVALPDSRYVASATRRPRISRVLSLWALTITVVALTLLTVTRLVTVPAAPYLCPPQCGRPPNSAPVTALPRFSPVDESFSVAYPPPGAPYEINTGAMGVTARLTAGDGGVLQLFAEPANGRSSRDIVHAVMRRAYPDAAVAYEIPNAMVGYQHGYGVAADQWPQSSIASFRRIRLLVLAAVKNDVALVAFAVGPEHAFGPDFGPGPPSGANLQLAEDMGKYVNSFQWRGDPPR